MDGGAFRNSTERTWGGRGGFPRLSLAIHALALDIFVALAIETKTKVAICWSPLCSIGVLRQYFLS